MLTVNIPQYDFGYAEQFTIYTDGRHLEPKDLTGLDVRLLAWSRGDGSVLIDRQLVILGEPDDGIVVWQLQADDTAEYGSFDAKIVLEADGM